MNEYTLTYAVNLETGLRSGDFFFGAGKVINTAMIPGFPGLTGVLVELDLQDGEPPQRIELVFNKTQLDDLPKQLRAYQEQKIADPVVE